jgi:DNA (cytosine-5)-methyltransferase 1
LSSVVYRLPFIVWSFLAAQTNTSGGPKKRSHVMMRRGIKDGEIPNSHRFSIHGPKVLALYRAAHSAGKKGRLTKEFLLKNNTRTDKKVLLDSEGLSSTLTTHPDESIHYLYPRNISLREMARIQSFPDDFHFFGRYTLNGPRRKLDVARCAQIGNAVPPLLGWGVARTLDLLIQTIDQGFQKASRPNPRKLVAA